MTSDIDEDPVGFLDSLMDKRQEKRERAPIFPGTTPPRNTATNKSEYDNAWVAELPHKEYIVGGVVRKMYLIGALAKALGKKPVTVRSWEAKGWIPTPNFRTAAPVGSQVPGVEPKGRRLYTLEQVMFLVEAHQQYILEGNDWVGFTSHISTNYPRN